MIRNDDHQRGQDDGTQDSLVLEKQPQTAAGDVYSSRGWGWGFNLSELWLWLGLA